MLLKLRAGWARLGYVFVVVILVVALRLNFDNVTTSGGRKLLLLTASYHSYVDQPRYSRGQCGPSIAGGCLFSSQVQRLPVD